jgi:hypothetical protein
MPRVGWLSLLGARDAELDLRRHLQPRRVDRLSTAVAPAVGAVLDPRNRGIDRAQLVAISLSPALEPADLVLARGVIGGIHRRRIRGPGRVLAVIAVLAMDGAAAFLEGAARGLEIEL